MPGNSFGHLFRITTFGESHGESIGVVIDGCPAGVDITLEEIQKELDRRKPGTNHLSSARKEEDKVQILSGIFQNKTLGTPIALLVKNENQISKDYDSLKNVYRPGHADFSYEQKYGFRDWRGGGRSSARETVGRIAAGAVAKKILKAAGIQIVGYITQIGKIKIQSIDEAIIENNPLRCPDASVLESMINEIEQARAELDSVGGVIEIVAHNVPAGLGEPVFHKLSADLAQAFMSIPASKGFEIGDGFAASLKRGSENNDELLKKENRVGTKTNHAGGMVGGISNGEDVIVRLALKPPSSIAKKQKTVDKNGNNVEVEVLGRHDPCVCPRAVPIAEAMMALTLVDHYLLKRVSQIEYY